MSGGRGEAGALWPERVRTDGNSRVAMKSEAIRVRDLSFAYPGGGFRLEIAEFRAALGEKVAVTGPSGSGKTTLLNLLAGILTPAAGSIEIGGVEVARLGPDERRDFRARRLGLVFQEFELLDYLDALDNVLLPYRVSPALRLDRGVRRRAAQLLKEVGLGDKLRRLPDALSQGERQRVAVCRALVTEPAALLCDEPTGNLDRDNRDRVIEILFRYSERTGAPLVAATHDLELAGRFDRALPLETLAGAGARTA